MSGKCGECGETTAWDQELASTICTHCGTLGDPNQVLLTSHADFQESSTRDTIWNPSSGSTLKGRNGWALAGQGKEARDKKNRIAMHEFIQTVASRLAHAGSASRAQTIFDQAMNRGQYRWGRKAKLTAGASVAIALREARKSDALHDIAYLLEEHMAPISRAFSSVISLLQLGLASADPSMHFSALQGYLHSLVQDPTSSLSPKLLTTLRPLMAQLPTVMCTAKSLANLLSRSNTLSHLPTPPTACALMLLALEGELRSSIPNASALADALSKRLGVGKGVVMQRYKVIYDLIEEWIREVPWLQAHERKKGGTGRSKVAKRVVVARGLKDVVQFQEEIWNKKLEDQARPHLVLDIDDEEDKEDDDSMSSQLSTGTSVESSHATRNHDVTSVPPRKKRKTCHERSVAHVSRFLLDPGSCSAPPPTLSPSEDPRGGAPDLLSHILTADPSNFSHAFTYAPTRLQLLAASRGGANETNIHDDELFAEGEMEGLMRSAEEVDVLRITLEWDTEASNASEDDRPQTRKGKRTRAQSSEREEAPCGSKRINMDALAKLLNPSAQIDEDDEVLPGTMSLSEEHPYQAFVSLDGEESVEEWRPLSPGGNAFDEDRYEI